MRSRALWRRLERVAARIEPAVVYVVRIFDYGEGADWPADIRFTISLGDVGARWLSDD